MLKDKLFTLLEEKEEQMIQDRRWLHEHPELSFEEKETSEYIAKFYEGKDCQVERNIG
ncbi:MAG: amidohydrolase, partial [Globicatella sulfidifaciens]|nr:amidohydrolase [Globicatella sulfidifaciens]